ncbi:MAG: UDP-glucose/GDP-mannose dehydrogenase family protein [Patescibacteria group bacterium]|jgi:UDPglucose 6-dehydrogenase
MNDLLKKKKFNIGIIGVGYVGLVTAASFAEIGNKVRCYDIDTERINNLQHGGMMPFYEPNMNELVNKNLKAKRLGFYLNLQHVVDNSDLVFFCVGTPSRKTGSVDLRYLQKAIEDVARLVKTNKIFVVKSTVPAGTAEVVKKIIKRFYKGKIEIVSNPEFLQEGRAIDSFLKAHRVVLGYADDCRPVIKKIMRAVYKPIKAPIFETNNRTAELSKYAANVFLATEISFINNIANLCDAIGADVKVISEIMKADHRIGQKAFLNAGAGYGGLCFPKDMKGFIRIYERNGYDPTFLKMVEKVNMGQRKEIIKKLHILLGKIKGNTIVILGASFKPDTDDIRDAPSITIIEKLLRLGAKIRVCDPMSLHNIKTIFHNKIEYCFEVYQALKGADAVVLVTEWDQYKKLDFNKAKKLMKKHVFVDGRNIYEPEQIKKLGFKYLGMGR